jgi:Na+/H+ antiporter NhaD/arsenite permease-like protein
MLSAQALSSPLAIISLLLFVFIYVLVIFEEQLHLRKSKPVVLGAGILWALVALYALGTGESETAIASLRHYFLEYAELLLFLVVAMTYINALETHGLFLTLKSRLMRLGLSYRQMFWLLGILAFFISAIADNLTTALFMSAVAIAIGKGKPRFVQISCIALVVASNAGGAFSPFGDITTLMVWQKGVLSFKQFFKIFIPSVVNFAVPALCMHYAVPTGKPPVIHDKAQVSRGGYGILCLFLITILLCVLGHQLLHLPPVIGMMTGLGLLQIYAYTLKKSRHNSAGFDIFEQVQRCEWDTLLFFYGVILCVGALSAFGYLNSLSHFLYTDLGTLFGLSAAQHATPANALIGILSALIDNIPVMFAVLTMHPPLSEGQWLLVTLTAGVGGSLLSIGSAAGVALMGQSKGVYTFMSHLKWTWAIFLGYVASIATHLLLNSRLF